MEIEKESEEALKGKSLKISIAEGSAYSVMDGFGLKYITPYAVAIGMSNLLVGVLSSLPALIGGFSQLESVDLIGKTSRKKIVISSVALQAFMWLPVIGVGYAYFFRGLSTFYSSLLLILFYTLLVSAGAFGGPAWNSWMKDLISKNANSYFGKRSGVAGTVGLVSTFLAGILLSYLQPFGTFYGFLAIFSIAFAGRSFSLYLFSKKYEPKMDKQDGAYFSFFQFLRKMSHNNFGHFVIFSSLISFAVAIASPFFSVYMLKNLGFGYVPYTLIITVPIVVTLITLPLWGKFGDKYGNIETLKICGSMIFLIPLLWFAAPLIQEERMLVIYLVAVETFSAIVWAGFGLATATFIFYAVTKEKLHLCFAYSHILNSLGAFLGALLGGYLSSFEGEIFGFEPILFVFGLSAFLRFSLFFALIRKVNEVRPVEKFYLSRFRYMFTRLLPRSILDTGGVKRTGHIGA